MKTPAEFEPIAVWNGWEKYGNHWIVSPNRIIAPVAEKTSLTDAEAVDVIKKLANNGYWPQLVYDDDGHWQLAMEGGSQVGGGCITVFCEQDMWFDTISAAVEEALLKLIAAEGNK